MSKLNTCEKQVKMYKYKKDKVFMIRKYYLLHPQGNNTVIIEGGDKLTQETISHLRENLKLDFDQLGILKNDRTLVMSGDELCINAIASAAFVCSKKTDDDTIEIQSCGELFIAKVDENNVTLSFEMSINHNSLGKAVEVSLQGITFFVYEEDDMGATKEDLINLLRSYKTSYSDIPAFGLLPYQRHSTSDFFIRPLVNVVNEGTFNLETSCGSGSISCAFNEYLNTGQSKFNIGQPSNGVIQIELTNIHNSLFNIKFKTQVTFLEEGVF